LITFIERHKLDKFDGVKLSEEEDRELKEEKAEIVKSYGKEFINNGVPGIRAKKGESFAQIALDYDLKVHQLYRYNDLGKEVNCKEGDTIYLKAKKTKTDSLYHTVAAGQTLFWISQRYAIRLDKLMERNMMKDGQEPAAGEQIYLRNKRDVAPKLFAPVSYEVVIAKPIKQDTVLIDTLYNQKVYDNVQANIETQKPVEIQTTDSLHEFKENLSFFHTVQTGETLYSIGKKYSVRVDAIQYLNLLEGLTISVGQRLIINPAITSADTKDPQSTPGLHIVRQGETMFSIAKQYGLKTADIMATNDLTTDQVVIGQKLVIVKPIQK
jgi:LysM repeat protein